MRGIPSKIQTPEDMRNIFALWQDTTWQEQNGKIDTGLFIERLNTLCSQQNWHVPIVEADGDTVVTRFFHEVTVDSETDTGLTVTSVEHFTPPEDVDEESDENDGPTRTKITLSAALPEGEKFLNIRNECNCLTINGFDLDEINEILGTLQTAYQSEVA